MYRHLTDHSWLPKNYAWVAQDFTGYCTKCARERGLRVRRMKTSSTDVCDVCLKEFSSSEVL